jgi:cytochrome c2
VIRPRILLSVFLLLGFYPWSVHAQQAADFFQQRCVMCHTIGGGRLVGPDLKDVEKRKDLPWLMQFIQNPKAMIDSGDAYAVKLQQDSKMIVMPTVPGLTHEMAEALLHMIEEESELPESRFVGKKAPERPFTAADVSAGAAIFAGTRPLSHGGPPCISCHTLGTLDGMGGGRLGPDLTQVYGRLGGRKGVGAWLSAPATTTMQAVFRQRPLQSEEILPLLAVFDDASRKAQPAGVRTQVNFFVAGAAGLCLGLTLMGWAWRGRIRTVRRSLIRFARGAK